MYRYDEFDHKLVAERTEQFRGQVERRINGALSEDAFKSLRLMNGVYLQLHAYMLRVGDSLWHIGLAANADAGAYCAQI